MTNEWIALTDDDRDAAFNSLPNMLDGFMKLWGWLHFAQAVEQMVREKNAPLLAAQDARIRQLEAALIALCTNFPTDCDMEAAGWATHEINAACDAYEKARLVVTNQPKDPS